MSTPTSPPDRSEISDVANSRAAPSRRDVALDGLRGLACLLVVLHHSAIEIGWPPFIIQGFTGVHLFFVLSGYLLSQPFLKHLASGGSFPDLKTFYLRRFVRIYPPYLVSLTLFIVLRVVTHTNIPTLSNIATHFFLIFNYGPRQDFYSINPVFWSLAIEAQYYLILPLIALLFSKIVPVASTLRAYLFIGFFLLVGLLSRGLENQVLNDALNLKSDLVHFSAITSYLDLFSWGMLVALLERNRSFSAWQEKIRPSIPLLTGLLLLIGGNYWAGRFLLKDGNPFGGDWISSGEPLYTLLFSPIICLAFALIMFANSLRKRGSFPVLTFPWLVFVGNISYSIYLYHVGVQVTMLNLLHLDRFTHNFEILKVLGAIITFPVVIVVSYSLFLLIEKPCLAMLERLKTRKPKQESVTVSS